MGKYNRVTETRYNYNKTIVFMKKYKLTEKIFCNKCNISNETLFRIKKGYSVCTITLDSIVKLMDEMELDIKHTVYDVFNYE